MTETAFDHVAYWPEIKRDIIRKYATAYSTILTRQSPKRSRHLYVEGFAGEGNGALRRPGGIPRGSAAALAIEPRFLEYHLLGLAPSKAAGVRSSKVRRPNVFVYAGDCNRVLLDRVFPLARFRTYRRALCVLDPSGLALDWEVIETAGKMRSVELFVCLPVMDAERKALWRERTGGGRARLSRMDRFWGDASWAKRASESPRDYFGHLDRGASTEIARAFQERLRGKARFEYVPEPLPLVNAQNAVVYYLFFASPTPVAARVVREIFDTYRVRAAA